MISTKYNWLYPLSMGIFLTCSSAASAVNAPWLTYNSGGSPDGASSTLGQFIIPNGNVQISGLGVFAGGSDDYTGTTPNPPSTWELQVDRPVLLWDDLGNILAQVMVPTNPDPLTTERIRRGDFFYMPIKDIGGNNTTLTLLDGVQYMLGVFYDSNNTGDKLLDGSSPISLAIGNSISLDQLTFFSGNDAAPEFPAFEDPNFQWRLTSNVLIGDTYPDPRPVIPEPSAIAGLALLGLGGLYSRIKKNKYNDNTNDDNNN